MIQNILMSFLVVNVLFRLNIKTTESFSCLPKNGIYKGVKYTGSDFYSEIHNIGPIRCFHECLLFKGCTFVNYDKMRFNCYLFNTDLNETFVEPDVGFAIMHNVSQDKEIMGQCLNHTCKNGKQCVSLRDSSACLKSGCRHKQYTLDDKKRICYRIIDTVNLTWSNAQQFCENDGGHLITLNLEDKNRFISNALQSFNSERFWIGLHDRKVEGNFHWINGTQFDNNSFDSWGPYQPNNIAPDLFITNADCCSMKSDKSWWDDDCETPQPFICEITL